MENNTGFEVDDHVMVIGGFDDGTVGLICDVDLSGPRPRFRVKPMGRNADMIGGLTAGRLVSLNLRWKDDTGSDSVRSWVTADAVAEHTLQISEEKVDETYSWSSHDKDGSLIDRGIAPSLAWAKRHAINASIWHDNPTP